MNKTCTQNLSGSLSIWDQYKAWNTSLPKQRSILLKFLPLTSGKIRKGCVEIQPRGWKNSAAGSGDAGAADALSSEKILEAAHSSATPMWPVKDEMALKVGHKCSTL